MRPQPLICVRDVEASSRWYQQLLGCESGHGGPEYERLVSDGRLILQLHRSDIEHHHGPIADPNVALGNGVLLWFEVADFDAAVATTRCSYRRRSCCRATAIRLIVTDGPNHWEIWLRDPDGYNGRARQPRWNSGWNLEAVADIFCQEILMPVCDRCGKGYEASERVCPSCGMSPDSTPPRCGPVAMLAMRIAWAAAFIAVIVCVLGGVIAVIRGAWFGGALLIFIFAPVGYGQHVALGMAIRYAEGEN